MSEIEEYVKANTSSHDEGHGLPHALQVCKTSLDIAKENYPSIDTTLLSICALVHDVCDHKFINSESKTKELYNFLCQRLDKEKTERVMRITDLVSFSKEKKKGSTLEGEDELIRMIVADADRIEALGIVGIKRCYLYTKGANKEHKFEENLKDLIKHAYDKLLRLYPEGYIKTKRGREIAEPLHKETLEIIKKLEQGTILESQLLINQILT